MISENFQQHHYQNGHDHCTMALSPCKMGNREFESDYHHRPHFLVIQLFQAEIFGDCQQCSFTLYLGRNNLECKYFHTSNCILTRRTALRKKYFEMFFYNWPLVSWRKISGFTVQPFSFFVKKMPYLSSYLCGKYFSTKIFTVLHQSKKELSDLDQNWAKTRHLLVKT